VQVRLKTAADAQKLLEAIQKQRDAAKEKSSPLKKESADNEEKKQSNGSNSGSTSAEPPQPQSQSETTSTSTSTSTPTPTTTKTTSDEKKDTTNKVEEKTQKQSNQ
jgi:hypothetical protein